MAREVKRLMCKSDTARDYIRENIYRQEKEVIIKHLIKELGLSYACIYNLYLEVRKDIDIERLNSWEEKIRQRKLVDKYKGRERAFFRFDDSSLYRDLIR